MLKDYILFFVLLVQYSFYGQQYYLLLTDAENDTITKRVQSLKRANKLNSFVAQAQKANITTQEIDSILIAKETFLFLQERIKVNSKLQDSLFLFSENRGTLKRENFRAYRKKLATILSQEQYYELYKDIIDSKITLAVQQEMNALNSSYNLNTGAKKEIATVLTPLKKESCLEEMYYAYDKKLINQKKKEFKELVSTAIQRELVRLGIVKESINVKPEVDHVSTFIEKAKIVGISDDKAQNIAIKVQKLNEQLKDLKAKPKKANPPYLYTISDNSRNSAYLYKQFEAYLTTQVTIEQYKGLLWEQLEPKIEAVSNERFTEVLNKYALNKEEFSKKQETLVRKWVNKYVTDEIVTTRYYENKDALAKVKVKVIKAEADEKYRELLERITRKLVVAKDPDLRIKKFMDNAEKQEIDYLKAYKILQACLSYELKQEELMATKKYEKPFVYSLETNDNSKTKLRDAFKYFLTKNLSKEEYKKLFWEQLKPEADAKIKQKLHQIKDTYSTIQGQDYNEVVDMISKHTLNQVVAEYYYSYDKKIAKQKVKALKYKFDKAYKSKIKQVTQTP